MGWLGNAWDRVSGAVVSVATAPFKAETYQAIGNGLSTAADAVGKAATWTYDNALKPAGNVIGTTVSAIWDEESRQKVGNALSTAGTAVADYTSWAVTHPGMFFRQAGQGLSNSVVGLGALAADAVRWAGDGIAWAGYNTVAGAINLGADDGHNIVDYYRMTKFSYLQDMAENSVLYNYVGYTREQLDDMVRRGEITERDASYAAGTKYATQAVGEIGSIVLVGAFTAGAGGIALGAARGGALGVRAVRVAEVISQTGRLGEIAAKPLYWFGRNPTLAYMERAALTAAEAPKPGVLGPVLRGPFRVFDPQQTEHAFASWFGRTSLVQNHPTLASGLRAAEGGFKWLNPLQANGRSVVAWSIEGGGAAMSYTVNSARENAAASGAQFATEVETQNNSVEAQRQRYYEMLREYGRDPATSPTYEQAVEMGLVPAPEGSATPPAGAPVTPPPASPEGVAPAPQPLRQDFQDNAHRDEGITHIFTIEGFEGLKRPTQLDPLSRETPASAPPAAPAPGMAGSNRP